MSKESSLGPVHSFLHIEALALCDVSRRYVFPMYHLSFAKQRFFKVIKFIYLFLTVSRFWVIVKKVRRTPPFLGYTVFFSNGFIPPTLSLNLSSIWNVSWDMVWGRDPVGTISFFLLAIPFISTSLMKKNPCAWRFCLYHVLNLSTRLCLCLDFVSSCTNLSIHIPPPPESFNY